MESNFKLLLVEFLKYFYSITPFIVDIPYILKIQKKRIKILICIQKIHYVNVHKYFVIVFLNTIIPPKCPVIVSVIRIRFSVHRSYRVIFSREDLLKTNFSLRNTIRILIFNFTLGQAHTQFN